MDKVLDKITAIVETYEYGVYRDLHEMHRILACNIFYLSNELVKAKSRWNAEYHNHESKVNAVKERHADLVVPELYLCRKILETAKGVSIAMSLEIKLN